MKENHIYKIKILIFLLLSPLLLSNTQLDSSNFFKDWIVYTTSIYGQEKMFIYNPFTNEEIDLGVDEFEPNYPVWSPNKNQIAFVANRNKLMLIPISCVIKNIDCKNQAQELEIPNLPYYIEQLEWSNDGTKIIYVFNQGANGVVNESRLEYINISEKKVKRVEVDDDYIYNSNWSPNDKKILLDSSLDWSSSKLMEYDVIEEKLTPMNEINNIADNIDKNIADASYSPDGDKIVFTLYKNDDYKMIRTANIYIYDIKNQNYKKIVADGEFPEWSVDGQKILFVYIGGNNKPNFQFYYYDLNTGEEIYVGGVDAFAINFDWGV